MNKWYVVHTKSKAEYQVALTLKERGFEVYLPDIDVISISKKSQKKPFFPCYLFIKVDLQAVSLSKISWIPGLRKIVSFGGEPVVIPDTVIDLIQQQLAKIAQTGDLIPDLQVGDTLEVIEGPFQGIRAIFEGPTTPKKRVRVLLRVMGQASRVQVRASDLKRLKPGSEQSPKSSKRPRRTRGQGRQLNCG